MSTAPQAPSPVHLWIYNHPFYGISDQVEFFLLVMKQHGYRATVGRGPRADALNVVIENFSEATSTTLIDFCRSAGKRVAVIMTEHLDFYENRIYIHGDLLWNKNDYMSPATQVARIKNLMDCVQYIRSFLVLGDLPELRNCDSMFPGVSVRALPFPNLQVLSPGRRQAEPRYDAIFTGYITEHRDVLLNQLADRLSISCPRQFVSRRVRDDLNLAGRVVLNLPQRSHWRWLSLMRIIAGLRCGRATISVGTADRSKISACCEQLDTSEPNWIEALRQYADDWEMNYRRAFDRYCAMALQYERQRPFPRDLFESWAVTDGLDYWRG